MRAAHARALVLLAAALACRGPRPEGGAAPCTHLQAERQAYGAALCEDVWTCARPPGGRFDRLGLHRLALCDNATGPVVLYLPGMHMNGELPIAEPRYDLRVYLAEAGVRTWGLDYRTHAVPADASAADL
jgi:acetyl esterase/lipase